MDCFLLSHLGDIIRVFGVALAESGTVYFTQLYKFHSILYMPKIKSIQQHCHNTSRKQGVSGYKVSLLTGWLNERVDTVMR